jgi:hypothetical protein
MSIVFVECNDVTDIDIGILVVIDATSGKAREFDEVNDTVADIVGASYPKSLTTGRIAANFDGLGFCLYDYFTYLETLQTSFVVNPNYKPFDPVNSSDPYYCCVALVGMVPVLKSYDTQYIPTAWKRIRTGTTYDVYLIH